MVDIKERLCTPEQAKFFKEQGVIQTTQYAWEQDPESGEYIIAFDAPDGFPKVVDWNNEENCYAAYDNTDLGLMLASLGFYPCGPTFRLPGESADAFKWWCDDINTLSSVEDTLYQGYGRSEAEAKAAMLQKLVMLGMPPIVWPYYSNRIEKFRKDTSKPYGKKPYKDLDDETT